MEGIALDSQQSVLIVDSSEETREVLETALQRRGLRTFAARRAGAGLELARRHHPDLIVLDLELDTSDPGTVTEGFAEQSQADHAPLVMLGSIRQSAKEMPNGEFVSKPYYYGPLIRRIEELLDTSVKDSRRAIAVRHSRKRSG